LKCWERSAKAEDEGIYRYDEVFLEKRQSVLITTQNYS
jgi:hypothetical protein